MKENDRFIKIEINFLQSIVDYLKKQPYEEVVGFLDILLNPTDEKAVSGEKE